MSGATFAYRTREGWEAPWDDYRQLRDDDPAHLVEYPEGEDFYVFSRFADVLDAARDTATFSSAQGLTTHPDAMAQFGDHAAPIVMMDPPEHTVMRRLVSKQMTPRKVASVEDEVRAFVTTKLDAVAETGHTDIVETLLKPLPSYLVAHYLGVPVEDRQLFDRWSQRIVAATAGDSADDTLDAFGELFAYATELIEARRLEPGTDLVSDLVAAGEHAASTMWIVGFVFTMITGGNDTATGLMGGSLALLDRHRDQRRILVEDGSKIAPAIEELLRLTSPVQNLARTTTRAVTLHGKTIPEQHKILLLYGSANHDEREFGPDAGDLDVERPIDRIVSLGYGAHHCLGAAVARLQARVALDELLARFPEYEVDLDRAVWAPGANVRRYESLPFSTGP